MGNARRCPLSGFPAAPIRYHPGNCIPGSRPACRAFQGKISTFGSGRSRQAEKASSRRRYKKEPLVAAPFFIVRVSKSASQTQSERVRLQAELLAALRTAASQHLAAIFGRHSLAEAMLLAALTLLGLIRSKHLPHTSYYPGLNGHRHRSNTQDIGLMPLPVPDTPNQIIL